MFGGLDTRTVVVLAVGSFLVALLLVLLLVLLLDRAAIGRTLKEVRDLPEQA